MASPDPLVPFHLTVGRGAPMRRVSDPARSKPASRMKGKADIAGEMWGGQILTTTCKIAPRQPDQSEPLIYEL
jgi:hypothetical protein